MEVFLSLQDPRELPKGTRDPLGFEAIWTDYGRKVVQNLTTITGSIEEFLTALLGFYFAGENTENQKELEENFLRFEQVTGYLRGYLNRQADNSLGGFVRGSLRVYDRLKKMEKNKDQILISSSKAQILSNQSAYGLWGLYSTALDMSGLIKVRRVQQDGLNIINEMKISDELRGFFQRTIYKDEELINFNDLEKFAQEYVSLLHSEARKKLLEVLLRKSDKTHELFDSLNNYFQNNNLPEKMFSILNELRISSPDLLNYELDAILKIDHALTAMNWIFDALRTPERKEVSLNEAMGILIHDFTPDHIYLPENENNAYIVNFVEYWNNNDFIGAAKQVLERHRTIMQSRNSAPWVEEENNKIKIRIEMNKKPVYSVSNMSYSYFIDSYIRLMKVYRKESVK